MRSPEPTKTALRSSRHGGSRYAAGRRVTTTSAGSARSDEAEQLPILAGAAQPSRLARQADRDPPDVAARGTARVLHHRAAGARLRVDLAALETPNALEHRERDHLVCNRFHTEQDARTRTN